MQGNPPQQKKKTLLISPGGVLLHLKMRCQKAENLTVPPIKPILA